MSGFLGDIVAGALPAVQALPGLLAQILGAAQGATGGNLPALLAQLENAGGEFAVELLDAGVEMAANRCRVGEDGLVDLDESRPHGRSYFFAAIKPARK